MKKITLFLAAVAVAVSASAQKTVVTGNKAADNWYVGGHLFGATPMTGNASFKDFREGIGVRVGKNMNTVFGLALEGQATTAFGDDNLYKTKTFVNVLDVNLLSTWNLSNLFAGYQGQPRPFEVIAVGGFGWGHTFGISKYNDIHSKVGVDFAINLGEAKAWQIYIEPSLSYALHAWDEGTCDADINKFQYNINNAEFQVAVGVNYKFGNSNGTHNFAIEQLRDQAEIDALNAKINAAKAEADANAKAAAAKDAEIARLKKALSDCENKPAPVVETKAANLQPSVVFKQGKSNVENSQLANIEMIAKYMKQNPDSKVKISGYASPEGSKELNQKLSEARAEAVKNVLVKKYKVSADRLETEGLGATDKLFDQVEFNRVALFNDTTK